MNIVYLHGFASGPTSRKARFFEEKFRELGIAVEVPDLAAGNFEYLTISGQLAVVEKAALGKQPVLIGSSLGGYLAALYAARHPEVQKLVLLAPAFTFPKLWPESLGDEKTAEWQRTRKLRVFHYTDQCERPLDYSIVDDCVRYETNPNFHQPALVFQGTQDSVVPPHYAEIFARSHPNVDLRLLNSGHELTDVLEVMWTETRKFLNI